MRRPLVRVLGMCYKLRSFWATPLAAICLLYEPFLPRVEGEFYAAKSNYRYGHVSA